MRPPRLILLLFCFIALPIFLTFLSLISAHPGHAGALAANYGSPSSRLRAFFSFQTPSSLFPPSAVISLTNDNSTFFLARPASFGGILPSDGLSGQLWVGRGFTAGSRGELGCSDVPGWNEGDQKHSDEQSAKSKSQINKVPSANAIPATSDSELGGKRLPEISPRSTFDVDTVPADADGPASENDGTDDHLHRPLSDSNPAEPVKPGQPAEHEAIGDKKKPTHADIQSLQESAEIAGKVVLLSRGGCGFLEKVKWAQRRGGVALIIGDDEPGRPLLIMYAHGDTSNVTIPALFTSYTTAHLLSSLVPPDSLEDLSANSKDQVEMDVAGKKAKDKSKPNGPIFTSPKSLPTATSTVRPSIIPAATLHSSAANRRVRRRNWLSSIWSAFGLGENSAYPWHIGEDSRRPPSSGNIDWVLLEDWNEEELAHVPAKSSMPGATSTVPAKFASSKSKSSSSHQPTSDEFVIGVQDWRDPDLVVSDTKDSADTDPKNGKLGKNADSATSQSPAATGAFKGGSITPGSGEYGNSQTGDVNGHDKVSQNPGAENAITKASQSAGGGDGGWLKYFRWESNRERETSKGHNYENERVGHAQGQTAFDESPNAGQDGDEEHEGLWVTLTPTTVSTNPFFDTLLVLVVSPLVTLTVVYALLLLRSRIRRRRWRAPKSVVERLPVRTYHTMSNSSSTTSSQVASPHASSPTSPLLQSTTQTVTSRSRPRSQTTSDVASGAPSSTDFSSTASSPAKEKAASGAVPRRRYTGRQVECVVCLEEYIDGQSRVMSLPCGHEFHADCITPWLVTRRRTCPICKGDVVRSMAHADQQNDQQQEGEISSDDIQGRTAETVNESPSAAIPILSRIDDSDDESDVERGAGAVEPSTQSSQATPRSAWRNLVSGNLSNLSGDTVWRQTPADRNR